MNYNNILVEIDDSIAVLTINRPRSLNSVNTETIIEVGAAFDDFATNDAVRGVIIIGSGDKAFIAGADITELSTKNPITGLEFVRTGQTVLNKIENLGKPVIAAVNGFALGGGCELAMACHIRVAAAHARFGQPEVGLGLLPGWGGTQRLPRLVGKGRAMELLFGGGVIDASEAYRIGLANCVVEAPKKDDAGNPLKDEKGRPTFDRNLYLAEVKRMLTGFLSKAPVALSHIIEAVNRGLEHDIDEGQRLEATLFGLLYATEDSREGLNAFLEKRTAKFTGR